MRKEIEGSSNLVVKYSNALFKEMSIPLQQCPVLGFGNIPFNLIYDSS